MHSTFAPQFDGSHYPIAPYSHQTLKLSTFSGNLTSKSDVSFDRWSYEVRCLQSAKYPLHAIHQAIRQSLKGTPADVLTWLGEEVTIEQILEKLQGLYGNVLSGEALIQKFYSEKMKPEESVTEWGCRLQSILTQAVAKGKVEKVAVNSMLRTKFWMDLPDDIKTATRHRMDKSNTFDELLVDVRAVEQEFSDQKKQKKSAKISQMCSSQDSSSDNGEILKLLKNLSARLDKVEKKMDSPKPHHSYYQSGPTNSGATTSAMPEQKPNLDSDTLCFRCGHPGHIQYGCKVKQKDFLPLPPGVGPKSKSGQLNQK